LYESVKKWLKNNFKKSLTNFQRGFFHKTLFTGYITFWLRKPGLKKLSNATNGTGYSLHLPATLAA